MPPIKKYCPICGSDKLNWPYDHPSVISCTGCKWVDYQNPIPVAAVLASNQGDPERKIVMVKRGIPPFKGEWCLPCGYMNQHEIPKDAACREMMEETGLVVRLEKILCVCNPMPGEINQITISYLARITGGELVQGDDAAEAKYFTQADCPTACFRSNRMLIEKWWAGRFGEITGVDLD